jgi:hypothetical protein
MLDTSMCLPSGRMEAAISFITLAMDPESRLFTVSKIAKQQTKAIYG